MLLTIYMTLFSFFNHPWFKYCRSLRYWRATFFIIRIILLLSISHWAFANNFYLGGGTGTEFFLRDSHIQANGLNTRAYGNNNTSQFNILAGYQYFPFASRYMVGIEANANYAGDTNTSHYRYSLNNAPYHHINTSQTYQGSEGLSLQLGYLIQQAMILSLTAGLQQGHFATQYNSLQTTSARNGFQYSAALQVPIAGQFYARIDLSQTRYASWTIHSANAALTSREHPITSDVSVNVIWKFGDDGKCSALNSNPIPSVSQYIRNMKDAAKVQRNAYH